MSATREATRHPITTAQAAVLRTPGHVLVEAGAGSGKTTTVVQLLLHVLGLPVEAEDGTIPGASPALGLEALAAITFTNAAAADLTRKLRSALRGAGRADLALDADVAQVGTIHAFCGDLLRQYALRAGLAPNVRVLDDAEGALLAADSAREVVHDALAADDLPGLGELLRGRKLQDVMDWVRDASEDTDRLQRWRAEGSHEPRTHEAALLELADRAAARRLRALADAAALDFDGLLVSARALLRRAEIRHAVQRRLRLLVIDEFQDVDPVQQEIAMLLGGLVEDDPQPTRLVLVGDPKQSIYRFRRADVTLWQRTSARFRAGAGAVLPLDENFRSKAAILGFVDTVVGPLLDAPLHADGHRRSYEVDFAPLNARAPHRDGDEAVELHVMPPDAKGKAQRANAMRALEPSAIALRLQALHRDQGVAWGEMAILVPGWKVADALQEALRAAGIPSYVPRGEGFWEQREVLDCLLLLRAVRDASDDAAAVGFLKSPFVGLRDDSLLAIGRLRERGQALHGASFLEAARAAATSAALGADERALLVRGLELRDAAAVLRDRRPTAELLAQVLLDTGYLAHLMLLPESAQRLANLRKLRRLLSQAGDQSLGSVLREVAEARARGDKVSLERLYGESGDVVTITTVHSAKGLEWDVVVLADLAAEIQSERAACVLGREGIAIRQTDEDDAAAKDARHEALKDAESQEQLAERFRLWYVAATRARHRLLLYTVPLGEGPASSAARRFLLGMPGLGGAERFGYRSHDGTEFRARVAALQAVSPGEPPSSPRAPLPALPPPRIAVARGGRRLSATQLMRFAKDPEGWLRRYVHRVPEGVGERGAANKAASEDATAARGRAIVAGQLVHQVLERLAEGDAELEELLETVIGETDPDAPAPGTAAGRQLRAFLGERVQRVAQSETWQTVSGSAGARRELPFTWLLEDGTAVQGALDLIAVVEDQARIVDIKSTDAAADVLAERYAVQAAVYTAAVQAIRDGAPATFELLTTEAAVSHPLPTAVDVRALVDEMRKPGR